MTEDFMAGADWYAKMSHIFTSGELRLFWALKKARGSMLPINLVGELLSGRKVNSSESTRVRVHRMRHRARGFGFEISSMRGKGYCMVDVMKDAA